MSKVEEDIFSTFASLASYLGYSDLHGRIIGALVVEDKEVSLQDLSKKVGYSPAAVSLSIDMLELVGIVKKIKKTGDRKLYIRLDGDMLEALRSAILLKIRKVLADTYEKFDRYRNNKAAKKLEKELKRLEKYIDRLADVEIPK